MNTWTEPWLRDFIENSIRTIEQSMYRSALLVLPMVSQPKLISSNLSCDFFGGHLSRARPSSLMRTNYSSTLPAKSVLIEP